MTFFRTIGRRKIEMARLGRKCAKIETTRYTAVRSVARITPDLTLTIELQSTPVSIFHEKSLTSTKRVSAELNTIKLIVKPIFYRLYM